jgi:hypothetical protein
VRYPLGVLALSAFSLLALGSTLHRSVKPAEAPITENSTPAGVPVIVELFTSEGCSSCLPADALLAELEARQPVANAQIIALEEHVDYWNNLGWMDPFSAKEWTARQQEYAASLGSGNVYTPQMVINGQAELVGGREQQARQAIEGAASRERADVSLTPGQSGKKGHAQFIVSVGKLTGSKGSNAPEVWLAITETGLHSNVTRGENVGEDLITLPSYAFCARWVLLIRAKKLLSRAASVCPSTLHGTGGICMPWRSCKRRAAVESSARLQRESKSKPVNSFISLAAATVGVPFACAILIR